MQRSNRKFRVHLSAEERKGLEAICRKGMGPVANQRRARILLLCDEGNQDGRCYGV